MLYGLKIKVGDHHHQETTRMSNGNRNARKGLPNHGAMIAIKPREGACMPRRSGRSRVPTLRRGDSDSNPLLQFLTSKEGACPHAPAGSFKCNPSLQFLISPWIATDPQDGDILPPQYWCIPRPHRGHPYQPGATRRGINQKTIGLKASHIPRTGKMPVPRWPQSPHSPSKHRHLACSSTSQPTPTPSTTPILMDCNKIAISPNSLP